METLKQLNAQASAAVAHPRGREQALAPFGWTGDKAAWIALVCLHSGAFTRTQCARFLAAHPERVRRVVLALISRGLAAEETVPGIRGIGRVCRIYARTLYRALGADHIRHRRDASPAVLMRPPVFARLRDGARDLHWLPAEAEMRGKLKPRSQGRVSTSKRLMRRVEPGRPQLRRTGLSAAAKADEPAYPLGPRFAGPRQGLAGGCAPSDPPNGNGT